MIEPEASLVAAVEPVDHVLDALDVAPTADFGLSGGMERAIGTPMLCPPTGQSYGGSSQMSANR